MLNKKDTLTLLKQANEAYAAINKEEKLQEQEELELWNVTLADGLEDE